MEVLLRQLYWNNVDTFAHFRPKFRSKKSTKKNIGSCNILQLTATLTKMGVVKGSLLIVHSSYASLESTGLSPNELINELLNLIGEDGTLAMPVIRKYKEEPKRGKEYLTYNMDNIECVYNVQKSPVITGLLPYCLMKRKDSVTSRHPLNPMTAVGPLAREMMQNNSEGEKPSPHGPNSAWKFAFDHNALVVGLGIDLAHYVTITHVAEEAFPGWPVRDWYRERKFKIVDKDFETNIIVKERKPQWGTLYYADRNLKKRILKENILHTEKIHGIDISLLESRTYINYLRSINQKGFPYIIPRKYLIY
jgi:aminoglycoside 3-N-acetyltransferase